MKKLSIEAGRNSFIIATLSVLLLVVSVFAFDKSIKSIIYNNFSLTSVLIFLFMGILPFLTALLSLKYLFSARTKLVFEVENETLRVKEQAFPDKEPKLLHELSLKEITCPLCAEELYRYVDGSIIAGEKVIFSKNKDGKEIEIFKTSFPVTTLSNKQIEDIYDFIYLEYNNLHRKVS